MGEPEGAPDAEALQFDRAELAETPSAGVTCAICQGKVPDAYFQVNGAIACPACKDGVVAASAGGSRLARFLKAGGLGLLAAVAGAALWIAIVRVTGYEIGLVAIAVGYLVGAAVRRGSGGRGGWAYQTLAVVLTYSAMVAYYVPYVIEGLGKAATSAEAKAGAEAPQAPAATGAPLPRGDGSSPAAPAAGVTAVGVLVAVALIAGIAFAAPFLAGAENLIGILILLFALYEAWKLNRRRDLSIAGPFQVTREEEPAAPAATA